MSAEPTVTVTQRISTVTVRDGPTVVIPQREVSIVSVGTVGPQGPPGADGAIGGAYTHVQGVPSAVWVVTHNLGYPPNVTAVDTLGRVVWGEADYTDPLNVVTLTFTAMFSGVAYCS